MKMYPRNSGEKRRYDDMDLDEEEALGSLCRLSDSGHTSVLDPKDEKRLRREIANSNERRRMQSINAGFSSLKALLPNTTENEKLSKAAILQQTADYIRGLEADKKELQHQNRTLRKFLHNQESTDGSSSDGECPTAPITEIVSTAQDIQQGSPQPQSMSSTHPKLLPGSVYRTHHNNKVRKLDVDHVDVTQKPKIVSAKASSASSVTFEETTESLYENNVQTVTLKPEGLKLENSYNASSPNQTIVQIKMDYDNEKKNKSQLEKKVKALIYPPGKRQYCKEEIFVPEQQLELEPVSSVHSSAANIISKNRVFTTSSSISNKTYYPHNTTVKIMSHTGVMKPHQRVLHESMRPGVSPNHALPDSTNNSQRATSTTGFHQTSYPKVEVEPTSRIPTPEHIEYTLQQTSSSSSPTHHMQHPSECKSNPSSQKSLNTICEAIRHLEGDLTFSSSDEPPMVVQTYEITSENTHEEEAYHQEVVDSRQVPSSKILYSITTAPSHPSPSSSPSDVARQQQNVQLHHQGGASIVYGLESSIISSEPQEAPLELTTSTHHHRIESLSPNPPHHLPQRHGSTFIQRHANSRPGVIMVKPS